MHSKTNKVAFVIAFSLLVYSLLVASIHVEVVKADDTTVYIRADGSVEGTDKIQRDGNVYTFTGNIVNQSIVIEKDNIVLDGAGYTLQGDGKLEAIWLENRCNVTIMKMQITQFGEGIRIMGTGSKNNTIIENAIIDNGHETFGNGITLYFSAVSTIISGNNITGNHVGIFAHMSGSHIISENCITENVIGVWIESTSNQIIRNNITNNGKGALVNMGVNSIYHNNFINNAVQADINLTSSAVNVWDDDYPSGGNYWSDYSTRYANATEIDNSGIGDTPVVINEANIDNYPFMAPVDTGVIPEFSSWIILPMALTAMFLGTMYKKKLKPSQL